MTVENMWFNDKKIRAENQEKKGRDFPYEYSVDDIHFDLLMKCAILNSTAVFNNSMPKKITDELELLKVTD